MTPREADLGVELVAVAVVASVAIALAQLTWRLTGAEDGRSHVAVVAIAVPSRPLDLTAVSRFAPFGTLVAAPGVAGDPSALGLQLRGIMLARPQPASTALIAAAGGPVKVFGIGDTLPGGAILDAVEFDLVVLRINGQLLTLAFPAKPVSGSVAPGASPQAAVPLPQVGNHAPVEQLRARAADPQSLLGSLGASATPEGYRVGPAPSDELRRAGLQPGDIVEKVNGQAVGDPARDRALFDEAVVAGRVRVEVVRDGKRIALSFPLH